MAETLPVLPDVQFVTTDAQSVVNSVISSYEDLTGRKLADGDPVRLWLLSMAYVIAGQRAQIDASAKSNLLYYARGEYLDHLASLRRVERIGAQAARTTLRFMMGAVLSHAVLIPAGTRVTADNEIYFQTIEAVQVLPGQTQVMARAQALTVGAVGNRYAVGALNSLVDQIAYVAGVSNVDAPQGGRDVEDDESLRLRIYQAPASFSTAGPGEAYAFWARTANSAIVDVAVQSPTPAVVHVFPLLEGGQVPGQSILEDVEAILTAATLRPIADRVFVFAPDVVDYSLEITWYLPESRMADAAAVTDAVERAVGDWIRWQSERLGRDINPDALTERLRAAGAKRAVITSPEFTEVQPHEVVRCASVAINFGGMEVE